MDGGSGRDEGVDLGKVWIRDMKLKEIIFYNKIFNNRSLSSKGPIYTCPKVEDGSCIHPNMDRGEGYTSYAETTDCHAQMQGCPYY